MARWALACLGIALLGTGVTVGGAQVTGRDREFLSCHWRLPVPPQGPAPVHFSPLERSLDPASCGTCHPVQLADWKTSLHARSMGPGVTGQLAEMQRTDPATTRLCLTCHAPLTEQPVRMLDDRRYRARGSVTSSALGHGDAIYPDVAMRALNAAFAW
jgi:hypothetical protein